MPASKTCIYNKYTSGKIRQMRYGKANKLLLRCAQATFGTPLIVHNYSLISKVYGTARKVFQFSGSFGGLTKFFPIGVANTSFYRSLDNC